VELIKFLHVHGADIAAADDYAATPLHYACSTLHHHHHHQQQQQQRRRRDSDASWTTAARPRPRA